MFNFSELNEVQILMFGLILLRMTAFIVSSAIFSSPSISVALKVLFSVVLTLTVFRTVATSDALVRLHELENNLLMLCARELAIGLCLGFVTRLFFFGLSMAGELVSISLGLGQAQMFNPMMGSMGNAMEQFYVIVGSLVYLSLNGHHLLIQGLVQSFEVTPVALMQFHFESFAEMVLKAQSFFVVGVKIAAPVIICMIIIQVGIALISRAVPQINVLVTSASITSLVGFLVIFVSLPLLVMQMTGLMDLTHVEFLKFLKTL